MSLTKKATVDRFLEEKLLYLEAIFDKFFQWFPEAADQILFTLQLMLLTFGIIAKF
jgi:hypothetical protein